MPLTTGESESKVGDFLEYLDHPGSKDGQHGECGQLTWKVGESTCFGLDGCSMWSKKASRKICKREKKGINPDVENWKRVLSSNTCQQQTIREKKRDLRGIFCNPVQHKLGDMVCAQLAL
jgi:hypothetical protein